MIPHSTFQAIPTITREDVERAAAILKLFTLFDAVAEGPGEFIIWRQDNEHADQALVEWSARRGLAFERRDRDSVKVLSVKAGKATFTVYAHARLP